MVFLLPEFVPGYEIVEVLTRYLMKHLPHDPACKDASRVFYGSTEASFPLVKPNVTLPAKWISEAIATSEREKLEYQQRIADIEKRKAELRDRAESEGWDTDALIQQALSFIPPRQVGSGNYDECIKVLMALNDYYGAAEGQAIAERWSPSIKGSTWNVGAKFRSFRSRCGISIGTLFHIAKQYGFKFPAPEKKFKRERSNEQRDLEIIEETSARLNKLRQKISNTLANPIRHITPRVKRRIQKPNVLSYVPGKLPAIENWEKQGKPKIQFANASDRKQLLKEAIDKGYSEILDNSHPGLGKSYSAGEFKPNDFGVDKLIYQDINHRNASTATVEDNFADIPTRNNGYKVDYSRSTPSGQPYRVRTKPGEQPDTPSNCHRTYIFNSLRDKNYNDAFELEESGISPICNSCVLSDQCKYSSGNGYGFRMQKRNAINQSDCLRTHPDTSPLELYDDDDSAYKVGRIWEEAGIAISSTKKTEVSIDDLYATIGRLSVADYPKNAVIKPLFGILERLLNQQIKPTNRYGFDDSEIKKLIRDNYESSINNSSDISGIESFVDK
ncbi:MAG: PriCT-2 domain-containing protein, partial [Cyanobacteria bacterium J06641_2]